MKRSILAFICLITIFNSVNAVPEMPDAPSWNKFRMEEHQLNGIIENNQIFFMVKDLVNYRENYGIELMGIAMWNENNASDNQGCVWHLLSIDTFRDQAVSTGMDITDFKKRFVSNEEVKLLLVFAHADGDLRTLSVNMEWNDQHVLAIKDDSESTDLIIEKFQKNLYNSFCEVD